MEKFWAGLQLSLISGDQQPIISQPVGLVFLRFITTGKLPLSCLMKHVSWLAAKGMEAIDGPINFGENDNNWGLLVEGFMQQGYGMPYNKEYYQGFF
jgi:hypothetical protein